MLKYKGLGKYYFGIGIAEDYATLHGRRFYFYFFKLLQRPPSGEMMQRNRDYKGFCIEYFFDLPTFGINL